MAHILVTLCDRYDREKLIWLPIGVEEKQKEVPQIKLTWWKKFKYIFNL